MTAATDLYAMGMIAYRLILGESYYREENVLRILAALLHGQLEPPSARNPNFGAAFDGWFKKACDRQPEGRFASAAVQVEALAEALGLPTLPIERPGPRPSLAYVAAGPTQVRPRPGVLRFTAVVALAVAVVGSVVALFVYRRSRVDLPAGTPAIATTPAAAPVRAVVPPSVAAPGVPAPGPSAPTALPVGARGTRRKSPTTIRAPHDGEGSKPAASPDTDPFRDQM